MESKIESGKPDFVVRLYLIFSKIENKYNYIIVILRQRIKYKPDS